MIFLDCLVSNRDRHGSNWELLVNEKGEIIGMTALFDHGLSLSYQYDDAFDYSLFLWDGDVELKHMEIFDKMCSVYPSYSKNLLNRCNHVQFDDFVKERYNRMLEIYKDVRSVTSE